MKTAKIIIDIKFTDGTYSRGIVAHSIEFYPDRYWQLYVYMTQKDVFKHNPRIWYDVEKVEVVGVVYDEH